MILPVLKKHLFTLLLLVLASKWRVVLANTEIINFVARETEELAAFGDKWPTLRRNQNQGKWSVQPAPLNTLLNTVCEHHAMMQSEVNNLFSCPHELWVILDLNDDAWRSFSRFTLRLSWPASYPTDFLMQLYDFNELPLRFRVSRTTAGSGYQQNVAHHLSGSRRRQYARIRLVDTGVLTPRNGGNSTTTQMSRVPEDVPFNLILEPLHYGVLPESVVPVVLFLVPVMGLAGVLVPFINDYLAQIANAARREMGSTACRRDKIE